MLPLGFVLWEDRVSICLKGCLLSGCHPLPLQVELSHCNTAVIVFRRTSAGLGLALGSWKLRPLSRPSTMLRVCGAASGDMLASIKAADLDENAPLKSLKQWLEREFGLPEFMVKLMHDCQCLEAEAQLRGLADAQLDLILLDQMPDGEKFSPKQQGEALHCLCAFRRLEAAKALLSRGIDPDFRLNGDTPLDVAFRHRRWEVVQVLLDGGARRLGKIDLANINAAPDSGGTFLYKAAREGAAPLVQFLLMAGADVDKASGVDYDTPLGTACNNGHLRISKLLLEAGANKQKPRGSEPLMRACRNGHADIVLLLLEAGSDKDQVFRPHLCTPLSIACELGHVKVVKLLLEKGASPNKVCATREPGALYAASESGHTEIVELLLKSGAWREQACGFDLDMPLHVASRNGHRDVVKLLQAARARSEP